jgi:site-specific DNA recombinase
MSTRVLRCAIYTRKSSEEGLDQTFNSLDAQREACASYIQSQRHEGWRLLPAVYDDGGYSGGTIERPALKRMLTDIAGGAVDLVVVYKVDRLTRSLNDFAKIVEHLDARNVSFVSVTQSFNTTTSMGRLTLNVLLSFAQFEREVTGERIRDKIAASKKKGMWMGGLVPLGYDCIDRKLVANAEEGDKVRHIFTRYIALGGINALKDELRRDNLRSKPRKTTAGHLDHGYRFTSGSLMRIVTNRIYIGEIHHRGDYFPGQHEAIVSTELWDAAQALRERTRRSTTLTPRARNRNPLLGLLVDSDNQKFQVSYTLKKGHSPYRYYVIRKDENHPKAQRLPAEELEGHVAACLKNYFSDRQRLLDTLLGVDDANAARTNVLERAGVLATGESPWATWRTFLTTLRFDERGLHLSLERSTLRKAVGLEQNSTESNPKLIALSWPIRLHRTGHDLRLVIPSGAGEAPADRRNESLIRFVAKGRRWYQQFTRGEFPSMRAIAKQEGVTERYVARLVKGSLLAPDLIEKILAGQHPITMTVEKLGEGFPLLWAEQRRHFGV